MVDLHGQYLGIKQDVDQAIQQVLESTEFIQGTAVKSFERALSDYLGGCHVISCGNGTDALQVAMMALDLKPGDEVILPVYTYVATAEVIALLNLIPIFADVDRESFNIDVSKIERLITKKTRAIVPVHLYGQCADMEPLQLLAAKHNLHVIEDAAQSLGAEYVLTQGVRKRAGTIGTIGTTSFFPSKNLGAFGDGGALMTHDNELAQKIRMIANHGQRIKYHHDIVGINSRLDTLQAAILNVKLRHLDEYARRRSIVADFYDKNLHKVDFVTTPARTKNSTHVFHQYTIQLTGIDRERMRSYLSDKGIPTMVYYPLPLHFQKAYSDDRFGEGSFPVSETLAQNVLSLPIHTEMDEEQLSYICDSIARFPA